MRVARFYRKLQIHLICISVLECYDQFPLDLDNLLFAREASFLKANCFCGLFCRETDAQVWDVRVYPDGGKNSPPGTA